MFEIGWTELLLIAVVAIIVIGPKELPQVMRSAGRALMKLRRSGDEFRRQFEDSVRESGFEDIQRDLREMRNLNPANQIRNSIEEAMKPVALPASPLDPVPPTQTAATHPNVPVPPSTETATALERVPYSDPITGMPEPQPLTADDTAFGMPEKATPPAALAADKPEPSVKPNGHHVSG